MLGDFLLARVHVGTCKYSTSVLPAHGTCPGSATHQEVSKFRRGPAGQRIPDLLVLDGVAVGSPCVVLVIFFFFYSRHAANLGTLHSIRDPHSADQPVKAGMEIDAKNSKWVGLCQPYR